MGPARPGCARGELGPGPALVLVLLPLRFPWQCSRPAHPSHTGMSFIIYHSSFSYPVVFLFFHGNVCNSNLLDFPIFFPHYLLFFPLYFCVQNYALSETVGFTLNVQVAISLIVFVGWNRRCLQAVKLWRISRGLIPQLTFNTVLIRVGSTKRSKTKNRKDNYYYK